MDILHADDGKKGHFFIEKEGQQVADMTYVWAGEKMIIDHTEVSETLKGMGAGKQLVHAAVLLARGRGFKILPLCPFAKAVFDKTPEYQDVLN